MKTKVIIKYLGFVVLFNAIFLYIAAAISLSLHETSFTPLFFSAVMCTIMGIFPQIFVEKIDEVSFHEGMAISVFGWVITCIVGMIPYYMWGGAFTFSNAIFESVAGYTTTGSTILSDVESLPKGLLFWRASTHFIGGIGIILFVLLILPNAKGARSSIYRSEVSGLSMLNFQMQTKEIAKIISIVYVSLTLLETLILWILGMTFFDAICHSFATMATGGFSTKNTSIAYFNNIWMEITISVFMMLGGTHFGLIYATIRGKKHNMLSSRVVRTYFLITFIGILLVAIKLASSHIYGWRESFRHASFQVISLVTTTGFATVDTTVWPMFTIGILIYFSIQCAMVGSTTGGLKVDRVFLFYKTFIRQIKQTQHPNAVYVTKMDGTTITAEMELQTTVYIIVYIFILLISTLLLSAMNIDGMTSFTASVATLGTVGPGFGEVGSMDNYALLPNSAKYILSVNMLLGRLEIMNMIALFMMISAKNK
ncbi:MAG: TrkH family potassium uptake protein [Petrimonas sp.]|nr:TrkH family potassium uptake protein [Petrimonas sp.]